MTNIIKNTIVGAALTLSSGAFLISGASLYHDADRRRVKAGAESCWICKDASGDLPRCFKIEKGKAVAFPMRQCFTVEDSSYPLENNSPQANKDYPKIKLTRQKCDARDIPDTDNCGRTMKCKPQGDLCGDGNG